MARTAVIAGTATAVSGGVARRQEARAEQRAEANAYEQQYEDQQRAAQYPPATAPPPPPAAVGASDLIDQLTQLGGLKDRGVLTEAEFEAQKARLLAH